MVYHGQNVPSCDTFMKYVVGESKEGDFVEVVKFSFLTFSFLQYQFVWREEQGLTKDE